MEALKLIPYIVLMLAVSGLIAGAAALSLGKFNDSTSDTNAKLVIGNATEGLMAVAEQFPTIGVIAVMVIIISLIAGVFVYFRYFG